MSLGQKTLQGLESPEFIWIDGDGQFHDMLDMSHEYLQNVIRHIRDIVGSSNTHERNLCEKKIKEVNLALRVLSQKISEYNMLPASAKTATLRDFNISLSDLWAIEQ